MKPVELEHGYLNVFPNRRHSGRVDGYGCPELSPMVIGPIKHKMPGIPTATNIENFHQFAKVYECDGVPPSSSVPAKTPVDQTDRPGKEFSKTMLL